MFDNGALADLRAAIGAWSAVDPATVSPVELGDRVVELRRLIDSLEGTWARLVATLDGSGTIDGGTAAWLRSACRLSPSTTRSSVVLARRLAERPAVGVALLRGEISVDHARLVTTALTELDAAAGPELTAAVEEPLLAAAQRCDPSRLRREIAHARHALTPDAAADADERAHDRRRLDVASTFDGTVVVNGVLDPEGGEALLTALAPLTVPTGPDDRRSPGQRRADALVELCHRNLDSGALPALGGERPHVTVLVPLTAFRPTATVLTATPTGTDGPPIPAIAFGVGPGTGDPTATESAWGAVLGARATRRLTCDASITRVVLDPDSQPLDVGRRTRVIPPAIRTALAVRDRGCVFPGCDRPAPYTDAHHIVHWSDGGPTSLDNLVLLCRTHHRTVHDGQWHLTRDPSPHWTAHPPDHPAQPRAA